MGGRGEHKEHRLFLSEELHDLEGRGVLAKVLIATAQPLSEQLRKELAVGISRAVQVKDVVLEPRLDKEIMGGIKIETANHTWDKSLKRQLTDIKEAV